MNLPELFKILKSRWLTVLCFTVVGTILGLMVSFLMPKVYVANSNGLVSTAQSSTSGGVAYNYTSNNLATNKIPSYVELGSLRSVAEYTINELNLDTTPEQLVNSVEVSNPADTLFIRVTAQASTPENARDIAETWIRGMVQEVNLMESGSVDKRGEIYLEPKDSAQLPNKPSSPNIQLNCVIGMLSGILLGIAFSLLRHYLDRKIRSVEDIERDHSITVIGTLPIEKNLENERKLIVSDNATNDDGIFAISESLRSLRTNIQFLNVDNPPKKIVVTSPLPGDGKSTIAANLALTLAYNNVFTVLVDADLRKPMQSNIFGIPSGAGLTDILADKVKIEDVAYQSDLSENLIVIPAGSIPPNPSEILNSSKMGEFIESLAQEAFVVIDAPPVIPVTDAAVLSTKTDGAILVTSAGQTTHDVLDKAVSNLGKVQGKLLGVVLNRVPKKGMGAAYYGYQYKGNYSSINKK